MLKGLITSLLLFVIAACYYSQATDIGESALADDVGAAGLPVAYASILAGLALVLLAQAVARLSLVANPRTRVEWKRASVTAIRKLARAAGLLTIGAAYLAAVPTAGYALSIAVVLAVVAWYFGETPSLRVALVCIAGGVLYFALFVAALGVDMPAGLWPALW
jgi:hypothetical protein